MKVVIIGIMLTWALAAECTPTEELQTRGDEYKPQYKYKEKQCWPQTGYCWCVDEDGNEVPGSKTKGELKCPSYEGKTMCQLMKLAAKPGNVGAYIPKCKDSGAFEPKQCWGPTGLCWCVDNDGQEIPRTKTRNHRLLKCPDQEGKTKCQLMELIFGRNGPKCKEDGQFEEKQCSAYGGYCWCVDKEGNEIQGSKKMSAYIQCTSHAELGKTACQKMQLQFAEEYGPNVPQCKANGEFEEKQCMKNGYCSCVDKDGKRIQGTGKFGDVKCPAN